MAIRDSIQRKRVYIAVMGVTGSGKSTFISAATGNDSIEIGQDLRSCTAEVAPYTLKHESYDITLIDTPGFNDTFRSESEVLQDIANWLDYTYRNLKIKLTGIIYMQALEERKMTGSSLRNLKMFKDLCGPEPMRNVVLVTTGWGVAARAGNLGKAKSNENQLCTDKDFWLPLIKKGSWTARFEDTKDSALQIILSLADHDPQVLKIQHELVDENRNLVDTSAGHTVNEELKKAEEKYEADLAQIRKEMEEARLAHDVEVQEALAESKQQIERYRDEARHAQDILQYEQRNERRHHENEIQSLKMQMETQKEKSDRERERDRKEMELLAKIDKLESTTQFEQVIAQMRANEDKVRAQDREAFERRLQQVLADKEAPKKGRTKSLLKALLPTIGRVAFSALTFPLLGGLPLGGFMTGSTPMGFNYQPDYTQDYTQGFVDDDASYPPYEVESPDSDPPGADYDYDTGFD